MLGRTCFIFLLTSRMAISSTIGIKLEQRRKK
jgi:hypothetical protein